MGVILISLQGYFREQNFLCSNINFKISYYKTINLEKSGISSLTAQEMKIINGGVKWWKVMLFGIGGCLFGEAVAGAYEAGYDAGSQNCQ